MIALKPSTPVVKLSRGVNAVEGRKQKQRRRKRQYRCGQRSLPCRRAKHDQGGRNDGTENREKDH